MPLLHVYTIAEFACCALFFRSATGGFGIFKYAHWIAAAFALFAVLNSIFWQPIHSPNSYARSVEAALMIIFCLSFFYRTLQINLPPLPSQTALQWATIGFFIYFSGAFFLFLFPAFNNAGKAIYQMGWLIHSLLVVLMYILFTVAFYLSAKRK